MEIIITVPDKLADRVEDAYAAVYGYDPAKDGTKEEFVKEKLIAEIKGIVVRYETDLTKATAEEAIKNELTIS